MIDLRGMPLTVVEASVKALQESPGLADWLAAFPGADLDLLTELAPVVAASIDAWVAYRVLADECEANGGHTYQVLAGGDGPAGVVCGHCTSTWAVVPALTVPSPDDQPLASGDGPTGAEGRPEADAPVLPAPPVAEPEVVVVRAVDVTRPTVAPAAATGDAVLLCGLCKEPIDATDVDLMRANAAIEPIIGKRLCGGCMLTCERNPEHVIDTYNQAVLSAIRWRERTCLPCMQEGKGA